MSISFLSAEKLQSYARLTRLDRPIGSLLLLWPTGWALWSAAQGIPDGWVLAVFTLGVFLMRSAGCVINDFADRKVDGHVSRTQHRPMPSGLVTSKEALTLFGLLALTAFALVLTLNTKTILLSFAALTLAFCYPFMKRFTHLPQLVLGLAFSWAIPMAYAAQTNALPAELWLLFLANVTWTIAYDTMYAMVDREDDLKIGIKSTAILFGRFDKLITGLLQVSTLLLLLVFALVTQAGASFYWGLLVAAALFAYQQRLISGRQGPDCFRAFLNNNYVGLAIFVGIVVDWLLR
ncbi:MULTISPECIES: 4-hydroxybenzoate octaprenyltransferase [unclassified Motilimonas]|uniref:4-hydroxybenzoate octaprenyltransferase n=1 Tax=Motilimonas TaxID=1914248 RepID=UPI001E3B0F8E|nr:MULTISPECIES: 4-hydroxybenzoate octaprenyltransferase [unclassified Motilimonas]MCE0556664.1 4-hydroxybenzoate octaprenyltransferase [Motilimonas sp. E26]MDO6524769.1 4-hydroxybenzoate octaprenyltransferase [Motilimonas sp. 1_MG-2023]